MLPMLPYLEIAGLTGSRSADVSHRRVAPTPRTQGTLARLTSSVSQWLERRRTIVKLSRLDDRILADIGIERADIAEAVRSGRRSVQRRPDIAWTQPNRVGRRVGAAPARVNDNEERLAA